MIDNTPISLTYYRKATEAIFGIMLNVKHAHTRKFAELDAKLRQDHIPVRDYAYKLLNHLRSWVQQRGWKSLPPGIFTGPWAYNIYITQIGKPLSQAMSLNEESFNIHVMEYYRCMQYSVHANISLHDALDVLQPMTSSRLYKLPKTQFDEIDRCARLLYFDVYGVEYDR